MGGPTKSHIIVSLFYVEPLQVNLSGNIGHLINIIFYNHLWTPYSGYAFVLFFFETLGCHVAIFKNLGIAARKLFLKF